MIELIVERENNIKKIALIENGKILEYYEDNAKSARKEGNIYIGTIKDILRGMQAAFVDIGTEKNGYIHLIDILPKVDQKKKQPETNVDIKDVAKIGDKLLLQVIKDSNKQKGARVSTHINLPSRYLVLMPDTNIITISQKIEQESEKERLLKIMEKNLPKNMGVIIRTSASGKSEEELLQDLNYVIKKWTKIKEKYNNTNKSPQLIAKSPDIVEKIIIDTFSRGLEKIIVNNQEDYKQITDIQKENDEFAKINLELKEKENILNVYDIKKQIKKSNERKVWLKCGGFITIDKTEALTAIDVNTGKYTGEKNLEDTIFKVNQEATYEIVKQIRLRDIGGIIIIDYIDMKKEENKEKIETILKEELKKDRAKTQVEGFTKLDLMELTRKHICSHNN